MQQDTINGNKSTVFREDKRACVRSDQTIVCSANKDWDFLRRRGPRLFLMTLGSPGTISATPKWDVDR